VVLRPFNGTSLPPKWRTEAVDQMSVIV
jgi:hypothetical protein